MIHPKVPFVKEIMLQNIVRVSVVLEIFKIKRDSLTGVHVLVCMGYSSTVCVKKLGFKGMKFFVCIEVGIHV